MVRKVPVVQWRESSSTGNTLCGRYHLRWALKGRQDLDKWSSYREGEHSKHEQRHMAKDKFGVVWIEFTVG